MFNGTKTLATAAAAAAAALLFVAPAGAVTINFDELAYDGGSAQFVGSPYSAQGYTFTSTGGVLGDLLPITRYLVYGNQSPSQVDPNGAALVSNREGAVNTLTRDDGGLFDFTFIDLAGTMNFGGVGGTVRFYANDNASSFFDLDFASDTELTRFALPFTSVESVTFFGVNDTPFFNFDNVEVSAAVPAPAAFGLLGLGIAGLVAVRRRRFA